MSRPSATDPVALVRSVRPPTPLEPAPSLGSEPAILLKREDLGPTRTFKWRGALCACEAALRDGVRGVATASTGNHALAVAWAARRLGIEAHVVVPAGTAGVKRQLLDISDARVTESGASLAQAAATARELAGARDLALVEDGASEAQLAGTRTIGEELGGEPEIDAIVVPVACGALAGGLAAALKRLPRPPRVVGVQVASHARMAAVLGGHPDPGEQPTGETFADGLADTRLVEPALSRCRAHLDEILVVDDASLARAVAELWLRCGILAEGAGAAALAALREHPQRVPGRRVALILSGANIDPRDLAGLFASADRR